jgi:hypothetical protein
LQILDLAGKVFRKKHPSFFVGDGEKKFDRLSPGWPRHDEKKFLDQSSQVAGSLRRLFPGLEMAESEIKIE